MLRSLVVVCGLLLVASACGGDDEASPPVDELILPLVKTSLDGLMTATLVEALPSPPAKGDNTWRVQISDVDGNALSDLNLEVVPFMLKHNHGTSATTVTPTDVAGEYEVSRINFLMGGVWEMRFSVAETTADRDVLFYVRVPD